jgi:hypothetical protein
MEKSTVRRLKKLMWLVVAAAILYLAVLEFTDFVCRRLPIYSTAVNAMQTSDAANHQLGNPLKAGWPIRATYDINTDTGHAEVSIPVRGANGGAALHVNGVKSRGVWAITDLYVIDDATSTMIALPH